jgi:rod shape-determining protein MreC
VRNRRLLVLTVGAVLLLVLQRASGWTGGEIGLRVARVVSPLTEGLTGIALWVGEWTGFHRAEQLVLLQHQVDRLHSAEAENLALRSENERLRNLLALRQSIGPGQQAVSAQVCSRSFLYGSTDCVVDRGRVDGVGLSTVAICPAGLVGRVSELSPHTSRVRFLTAPGSHVPAVVAPGNGTGLVVGRGEGTLELSLVGTDAPVNPGDVVQTSGLGEVYPSGVTIGRVVRLLPSSDGLSRTYLVQPAVDSGTLLELLLLSPR